MEKVNLTHLVRTLAVVALLAPVTFGLAARMGQLAQDKANTPAAIKASSKAKLMLPCIKFQASKDDSKLEREAKNEIDTILGGEVSHGPLCKWVMR